MVLAAAQLMVVLALMTLHTEQSPSRVQALVSGHVQFLRTTAALDVHDLVHSLMEVAEGDDRVAYHLWVLVFPVVWASLSKERQLSLAKPTINLISKFSEEIASDAHQPAGRHDNKRASYMRVRRAS